MASVAFVTAANDNASGNPGSGYTRKDTAKDLEPMQKYARFGKFEQKFELWIHETPTDDKKTKEKKEMRKEAFRTLQAQKKFGRNLSRKCQMLLFFAICRHLLFKLTRNIWSRTSV